MRQKSQAKDLIAPQCQQTCILGICRKTMDDPYGCGGCCSCLGGCQVAWEHEQERLSYPRLLRFSLAMRIGGKIRDWRLQRYIKRTPPVPIPWSQPDSNPAEDIRQALRRMREHPDEDIARLIHEHPDDWM